MTHHLLIASEQLWPNLLGMAALKARDGGIRSLVILHTNDEVRSKDPAKRIRDIARALFGNIEVKLVLTDSTSQAVFDEASKAMQNQGRGAEAWSINCSGGTKTMFAGLLQLFLQGSSREAIYREVNGDWYELKRDPRTGVQCIPWAPGAVAKVELPVETLVRMQMGTEPGATWSSKTPSAVDVRSVTEFGITNGWDWRAIGTKWPGLAPQQRAGFVFEAYFAGLVKVCGGTNLAASLQLDLNQKLLFEFDIIVSTGRKLVLFDLKLTEQDEESKVNQFSRLGEDKRKLGGLGADAVLIRPNWSPSAENQALAAAHQIKLWTQTDMPNLVGNLRKVLGTQAAQTDPELAATEALLVGAGQQGQRLIVNPRSVPRMPRTNAPIEQRIGWLNLHSYLEECLQPEREVVVLEVLGRFLVLGSCEGASVSTAQHLIDHFHPVRLGIEHFFATRLSFLALLLPHQSVDRPRFIERLAQLQSHGYRP